MYAVRDLSAVDYESCEELIQDPVYKRLFGDKSIEELHLECCYASVAVSGDDVVALLLISPFAQYYSDVDKDLQPGYVNQQVPKLFTDFINDTYKIRLPFFTTKFVRMAAHAPGQRHALSSLLRSYFQFDPKNEVLVMVQHPFCVPPQSIAQIFPELDAEDELPPNCTILRLCQRSEVLRPLTVSTAQMKDHDDLVGIFEQQNTNLRQRFGEFYLADLIQQSDPTSKLAIVGSDYEINSDEILKPVCFLYAEKFNQFHSDDDTHIYSNLLATHNLEKYSIQSIPTDKLAFVRATACLPQAESRSSDLIQYLFNQWSDIELLILSLPSSSSCMQMQMLRMFTLIEPRSCLSPKESLFVCHRDAWVSQVCIQQLISSEQVNEIKEYINIQNQRNQQAKKPQTDIGILCEKCRNGTVVAFSYLKGKKSPVAVGGVDLTVCQLEDKLCIGDYIHKYAQIFQKGERRINETQKMEDHTLTHPGPSIWSPPVVLQCKDWCKIHYDCDLSRYGVLKTLTIDPLYLQFKDEILDAFMMACGVDGFLLQIGFQMQQFIRPVYEQDKFQSIDCDPTTILSDFEKDLIKSTSFINHVTILHNPFKKYYDGQLGADYENEPKPATLYKSHENSMYSEESTLNQTRKNDEHIFNAVQQKDEQLDLYYSALRSLQPEFSLFCLNFNNIIRKFVPPIAHSTMFLTKPPIILTDRLVIVGFGIGLLAALATLQDSHQLAKFKSVTVVHPAPGMIYQFNYRQDYRNQIFDHGESMQQYKMRCSNLIFDQYIGDIYEINMKDGFLKMATGAEVCFDLLMICPDGSDSESLRSVPYYNLNSSVAFGYGNVDPCGLALQVNALQGGVQLSTFNKRGFGEEEISSVLSETKNYTKLLASLINDWAIKQSERKQMQIKQEQQQMKFATRFQSHQLTQLDVYSIVKQRLHSRTFLRFLTKGTPLQRRQMAAVYSSTYVQNLNQCIQQLYTPAVLKQLTKTDKEKAKTDEKVVQEDDQRVSASVNGYRYLSPGAKSTQFIQIQHPEVQAELPLIMDRLAEIIKEAREQLFPTLHVKLPPKGDQRTNSLNVAIADAARTTVCVMGDTFEAFALVQGLLDRKVPADSIVLLIPQDPNADLDIEDDKQNAEIEYLMAPPGYCKFKPKKNVALPKVLGKISEQVVEKETVIESKSTVQNAEKRSEAYPNDLHRTIFNSIQFKGVNILQNVKIIDVLASQTQQGAKMSEEETENKSESESEEDGSNDDFEDEQEAEDDDFDETKPITDEMIIESLENLNNLDELDVCLAKKVPGFAEEFEQLNEICDQILLGNEDKLLKDAIAPGDDAFNVNDLPQEERQEELNRLLKLQITKLSKKSKRISAIKKRYKKKSTNGCSLCGLKLQFLKTEEEDPAVEAKKNIVAKANIGRMFTGEYGVSIRMLLNNADQALNQNPGGNQVDVHCCCVFLTEPYGVPNNISSAIMRSDLVFDKALILNSYGESSDPRVYAAGNIAKINRDTLIRKLGERTELRLGFPFTPVLLTQDPIKPVVSWSLYSQHETAQYSTYQLVQNRLSKQEPSGIVPEFPRPLILNAHVPGGYVFRISRPLRDIRDQKLIAQKMFRVVETGDLSQSVRWCRLEIDPLGIVDQVCIFSKEELEEKYKEVLFKVVGMPVSLFNQLEERHKKNEVADLIDFFCNYQVQALLSNSVMEQVNQIVIDVMLAKNFKSDTVLKHLSEASRSIGDIDSNCLNPELGTQLIKDQSFKDSILKKLMEMSRSITDAVKERFYELGRDRQVRGNVKFE